MKRAPTLPVAVEQAYDLWLWLDGRVADFPAFARQSIGRRALDAALDVLAELLRATYAPRMSERIFSALIVANERLALEERACLSRAQRNPTLLLRLPSSLPLRFAARTLRGSLLFQPPPRSTRSLLGAP